MFLRFHAWQTWESGVRVGSMPGRHGIGRSGWSEGRSTSESMPGRHGRDRKSRRTAKTMPARQHTGRRRAAGPGRYDSGMELNVLRVFLGPDGGGGNPLGVFLDGTGIEPERRQAVALELGYSETVFVDEVHDASAHVAIFTPGSELPFAGHPTVGTSWFLAERGQPVDVLHCKAGDVATWQADGSTWVRARAEWAPQVRLPATGLGRGRRHVRPAAPRRTGCLRLGLGGRGGRPDPRAIVPDRPRDRRGRGDRRGRRRDRIAHRPAARHPPGRRVRDPRPARRRRHGRDRRPHVVRRAAALRLNGPVVSSPRAT